MTQEIKVIKRPLWVQLLGVFVASHVLLGAIITLLYYLRLDNWLVVIVTIAGALDLGLIVFITAQVTRRQTIETLKEGAAIALQAQQINDAWDAKKTSAMTTLVREGVRLGASNSPRLPAGPAPLPLQVSDWLQLPDPMDTDWIESEDIDQ